MTNGIENGFILTNIFGDDFNSVNSEVEYSRSEIMAGRMSLDIIVNQNVKYPPNKWKEWEKVYVKIDFWGIKEISSKVYRLPFIISKISVVYKQNLYEISIQSKNNDFIKCKFILSRIQNVKPLAYNEKNKKFEICE